MNRLTREVQTKTIYMIIQKLETALTPQNNNYDGLEYDGLESYDDFRQPWKLNSGASGCYVGPRAGIRNRQRRRNGIKIQVADGNTSIKSKKVKRHLIDC